MKNLRKKLFLSILAVAFAVVSLGTSTFAWFAMNNTVTATGMTVSANSDSEYLVITMGEWSNTVPTKTVSSTASASLFPVAPAVTLTSANVYTASSWHYTFSSETGNAQVNNDDFTVVANDALGSYVAKETFYVGLNVNSGAQQSEGPLKLTGVDLPENTGISVVVVCGNNIYPILSNDTTAWSDKTLADHATISGSTIDVYYFIYGADVNVHSVNAHEGRLTGTVELSFGI